MNVMFQVSRQRYRGELRKLQVEFPNEFKRALEQEALIDMHEARKRTPVLSGELQDSGRVESSKSKLQVRIVFGNEWAYYAAAVHEDLDAFHDDGQAKYLESVYNESAPYWAQRIQARVRKYLTQGRVS